MQPLELYPTHNTCVRVSRNLILSLYIFHLQELTLFIELVIYFESKDLHTSVFLHGSRHFGSSNCLSIYPNESLSLQMNQLQSELRLARSLIAERDSEIQGVRNTNNQVDICYKFFLFSQPSVSS